MPSRSKRSSRPFSSPLPLTPPPPSFSKSSNFELHGIGNNVHFQNVLLQASEKFPKFVGENAFIGKICDQDKDFSKGNQARVWMSEFAMVSASIKPGSLVSVSLPSIGEDFSCNFPLKSLTEEYSKYNVDIDDKSCKAGIYFAIATAFPSSKVLKDGVKLSWGLACTMGITTFEETIFICPVKTSDHSSNNNISNLIHMYKCTSLHLNLIQPKSNPGMLDNVPSDKGCASPDTPLPRSSVSSPSPRKSRSTVSFPSPRKSRSTVSCIDSTICLDTSSVNLALKDEMANELLQTSASRWLHGRCLLNGNIVVIPLMFGKVCSFTVEDGENHDDSFLVDTMTKVYFGPSAVNSNKSNFLEEGIRDTKANDMPMLGGLSKEIADLKEIIMFSLANKGQNLPRYKGVLLYGPPGTGKTSLACYCAREANVSFFTVNGPEIVSQYFGESEQTLHQIFDSAKQAAPSVIFIDEFDSIAPSRETEIEDLSVRIVATVKKLMDEIQSHDYILLIAASNRPDSIDSAMRRPGRLDREIKIGVPSPEQRLDILQVLLSKAHHSLNKADIETLASLTHGFVGADLAALCNEAAMIALRNYIKSINSDNLGDNCSRLDSDMQLSELKENADGFCVDHVDCLASSMSELTVSNSSEKVQVNGYTMGTVGRAKPSLSKVTFADFEKARMKVRPSAMREVMLELPKVRWEDIGGLDKVKKQLIEAVELPHRHPSALEEIGIPCRTNGLLMIGPPGCSKTLLARAVASEAKLNFLAVKGPELFNKWVGESEKAVKSLFAKARANSPAIIFFDEIDALAVSRGHGDDGTSVSGRVLRQLLVEMDGLEQRAGVTVIAATNRPDKIDSALLRPGRFDELIDVQLPDETDREEIFRIHTKKIPCHADVRIKELAQLTEGYTGADIKLICREAALSAFRENFDASEVTMNHFKIGIGKVRKTDFRFYEELALRFRRFVEC